ncbi:DUF1707 SHOCT-like domain-containing protein [Spirillospora sp. CA-294931]|uniref:DUF1707 SHOCT-like domain-containing protein n=1 Tax=Spirillospora sp. CA-294931 TaxID=3240042 RepID=UPI003D8DC0EF
MTNLPERAEPSGPPQMRASDTDRDRVAQILRDAAGEGRIGLDELDERLNTVYTAKTYAELEPVVRDLPATQGAAPVAAPSGLVGGDAPVRTTGIAVLSGFNRRGVWKVPAEFTAFAFWGGGTVDLREATFAAQEVRIRAWAIMGGIEIIVPDDIAVDVRGIGVMGGFNDVPSAAAPPGAPRVVITGLAFWGGVGIKRKNRKKKKGDSAPT